MKKRFWLVVPAFFIALSVLDIYGFITDPASYPIGGEMFGSYSIYRAKWLFLTYQLISVLLMVLLIVSSLKYWKKMFWVTLILSLLIIIYPMITNQNGI